MKMINHKIVQAENKVKLIMNPGMLFMGDAKGLRSIIERIEAK